MTPRFRMNTRVAWYFPAADIYLYGTVIDSEPSGSSYLVKFDEDQEPCGLDLADAQWIEAEYLEAVKP